METLTMLVIVALILMIVVVAVLDLLIKNHFFTSQIFTGFKGSVDIDYHRKRATPIAKDNDLSPEAWDQEVYHRTNRGE